MSHHNLARPRPELPTSQLTPERPQPGMWPPHRSSPRQSQPDLSVSLPPLRHLSSTPPTPSARRHDNPLGLHSMLNPPVKPSEQQRQRQSSASQIEPPSPVDTQHSHSLPSISRHTSVDSQDDQKPVMLFPPPRPSHRHMLTPESPHLSRTKSLGTLNPPTGTIDAHQSPFLTASTRPSDPVTSQPALPTPPLANRPSYFPPPVSAPGHSLDMLRTDLRRSSSSFTQSGSASPIAQYSPYSRSGSIASGNESHHHPGHYAPGPPCTLLHEARSHPTSEPERNMIPMAPTGQSSIQMMTIKSQHGHPVQIPVDVQAASKGADEKRKRNARASSRFRARRKVKMEEDSRKIPELEQQVRDAFDSIEFYRKERDYFRSIVYQQPGAERYHARAASPQLKRLSVVLSQGTPSVSGGGSDRSFGDYDDDTQDSKRNVRRRTNNYHGVSGPSPTDSIPSGPSLHEYRSSPFARSKSGGHHMAGHGQPYSPDASESAYREQFASDDTRRGI
jgi:hypothetical protein